MQAILLNTFKQQDYENRKIRLCGTEKNLQQPSKWIDKVEKWHWVHTFIYTDNKEIIKFEFDYNDKFLKIWTQ
jgi:hypothetical protein